MPNKPSRPEPEHSCESLLLGGRVRLLQPETGYRAGMDAALLAAAVGAKAGERVLEVGCGAGAALLQAARRFADARYLGVERNAGALELAQRSIALNSLENMVEARSGDVADGFGALGLERFDIVFANPPFFDDAGRLRGPHPAKREAWLADGGLEAWTGYALKAVRDGGRILFIHRADRLADLLALLGQGAGSFQIRPVQPFADQPAKRVLVRAIKTGRAPLTLLPALVMHEREGAKHTQVADAILRGEAGLDWA